MGKNKKDDNKEEEEKKFNKEVFKEGVLIVLGKLKDYKKEVYIILALSVVGGFLGAIVPYLAGRIFDEIVKISSSSVINFYTVFTIIGAWFLVKLTSDLTSWYVSLHTDELSTNLQFNYKSHGFHRFLLLPLSFFSSRSPGEIASTVNKASRRLSHVSSRFTMSLLPEFLSILAAFIITFFIYKPLSLLLMFAVIVYVFVLWGRMPELSDLREDMHDAYVKAHKHGFDTIDNVKEVKQAGTEKHEKEKMHNLFSKAADLDIKWVRIFRGLNFSQKIIIALTQLSIFATSVFLVRDGLITPGELVAFNGYAGMLFGPFVTLGRNWQRIQSSFVELVDAQEMLDTEPENYNPEGAADIDDIKGGVEFRNVSFSYPSEDEDEDNEVVLKDISFSAEPGDDIAFVGKSGGGKSTLIKLLLGFYFPDKGEILVDGNDIRNLKLSEYRKLIGVVPQEPVLFNDTITENIKYGKFDASEEEIEKAAKNAHAHEFIEDFPDGYDQKVGWRGIKLSSGQKQRIALARAFLKNPSLLILDEPTSALDAQSEVYIQESIEKLMEDRTTFVIAHRLSTVREADNIIVLDKGKIIETGSHKELMEKEEGLYKELYEMQTSFY